MSDDQQSDDPPMVDEVFTDDELARSATSTRSWPTRRCGGHPSAGVEDRVVGPSLRRAAPSSPSRRHPSSPHDRTGTRRRHRARRRHRHRRVAAPAAVWSLVGAAVAGAAAAALITGAVVSRNDNTTTAERRAPPPPRPAAAPTAHRTRNGSRSAAPTLAPGVSGSAQLTRTRPGWRSPSISPGCPARTGGDFYQLWVKNCDGSLLVPAGSFHDLTDAIGWVGVSMTDFPVLTITQESAAPGKDAGAGIVRADRGQRDARQLPVLIVSRSARMSRWTGLRRPRRAAATVGGGHRCVLVAAVDRRRMWRHGHLGRAGRLGGRRPVDRAGHVDHAVGRPRRRQHHGRDRPVRISPVTPTDPNRIAPGAAGGDRRARARARPDRRTAPTTTATTWRCASSCRCSPATRGRSPTSGSPRSAPRSTSTPRRRPRRSATCAPRRPAPASARTGCCGRRSPSRSTRPTRRCCCSTSASSRPARRLLVLAAVGHRAGRLRRGQRPVAPAHRAVRGQRLGRPRGGRVAGAVRRHVPRRWRPVDAARLGRARLPRQLGRFSTFNPILCPPAVGTPDISRCPD